MNQHDVLKTTGEEEGLEQSSNKMEALLAEEGLTIDFPKRGEIRKGTIASVSDGQILVSVGAKSEGIIAGKELDAIDQEDRQSFKEGDELTVYVITPEDSNGNLILSYNRALEEENWQTAEELLENEDSYNSKIDGYNKGGLLVSLGTIRGFVPASQIGLGRRLAITGNSPEERYSEMVGEEIEVCVIEVDRERRRLILSERAASSETRDTIKERVIEDLKEGEIRSGRVTSLADFGAFVNISGADGLVHLSELSWEHVNHPSEILEVGQEIKVKVISIDPDRKRIGLSIRRLQSDPWDDQIGALTEGQLVEGKITRLTNFGAFARLLLEDVEGDLEGLIHISEISEQRIEHPKELLKEGDVLTLRIIKIEEDTHRIGLSMRRVDSPAYTDLDWKTLVEDLNMDELAESSDEAVTAEDTDVETEAEAEINADADIETEAEAEIDTEADMETEAEAEIDTEADMETEAEAEIDTDADVEPKAEAEIDTEADVETEAEAEIDTDADVETEAEAEIDTDADVESETEAEIDTDADVESETEVEIDTDTAEETPSEPQADEETEIEAELESETVAEVETVEDETPEVEEIEEIPTDEPSEETSEE